MMCYNCIVQLNTAYNFKNVVIETSVYLERVAIENGGGGTLTPAPSVLMDDDQGSGMSSRPTFPSSPPAVSLISSRMSATSPPNNVQEIADTSASVSEATEEITMLDPSQIKTEPTSEENGDFVLRSAIHQVMASHSEGEDRSRFRGSVQTSPSTPNKSPRVHRKRAGEVELLGRQSGTSPIRKPMVSVHKQISRSHQSDKAFLEKILHGNGNLEQLTNIRVCLPSQVVVAARARQDTNDAMDTDYGLGRGNLGLEYDMNNSKVIKEILANLPKKRLRNRLTSSF